MNSKYPHLCQSAAEVADCDFLTRMRYVKRSHWIGYTQAMVILNRIDEMLLAPRVDRMDSMVILAETNNGKTSLLKKAYERHSPRELADGTGSESPIILIQAPPVADEKRLYTAILNKAGGLGTSSSTKTALCGIVTNRLEAMGTRMLMIDEIHHLIAGSTTQHRNCMNVLKYLANELQLSVVVAGISTAHYALATIDPQLENRFKPAKLPRWKPGPEFNRLLASIETIIPLRKPSGLQRPSMANLLAGLIDGKIGELFTLLAAAAAEAIKSEKELIDEGIIAKVQDIAPTRRKGTLNDGK